MIDIGNLTFAGLITLGVVNVITFFRPNISSSIKWITSLVVAFGLTFVPVSFGSLAMDHLKQALEIAFAASGGYKLATKAGGQ